jgi:lipoate-protein ligase A
MPDWYLLREEKPLSAAENMARDEYLFQLCHRKKCGFFRLYSWKKPSFSFGVSQRISRAIHLDFIRKTNCEYVRRITGGKTVLHHHEITYSVASSEARLFQGKDLKESYMLISSIIVRALSMMGLDAYLSKAKSTALARSDNPCFSFPTLNEIEVGGKKIVGSAQKRDKQALLQHGSIPIRMDYDMYANGSNSKRSFIEANMTTLSELVDESGGKLIDYLVRSFREFIGIDFKPYIFDTSDKNEIENTIKKYQSVDWNHRL